MKKDVESVIARRKRERETLATKTQANASAVTAHHKELIPVLLAEGMNYGEICACKGFPSRSSIYREFAKDQAFRDACSAAQAELARALIDDAQTLTRDAVMSDDTEAAKRAEMLARVTAKYAEQIAPKEFGALVKLAGADGGAITVSVVDYANVARSAVAATSETTTCARGDDDAEIDAD